MAKYRIVEETSSDGLTRYKIQERVSYMLGFYWEDVFLFTFGAEPLTLEDCEKIIEHWLKPPRTWTSNVVKVYG